jgi:hypothetical protein
MNDAKPFGLQHMLRPKASPRLNSQVNTLILDREPSAGSVLSGRASSNRNCGSVFCQFLSIKYDNIIMLVNVEIKIAGTTKVQKQKISHL